MLVRGILLAVVAVSLAGQTSTGHFAALQKALGLSDSQVRDLLDRPLSGRAIPQTAESTSISHLHSIENPAAPKGVLHFFGNEPDFRLPDGVLDDSQRAKLKDIEWVLHRVGAASAAIQLGLITSQQWVGHPACNFPISDDAWSLGLSASQISQFQKMLQAARVARDTEVDQKRRQRAQLLSSGSLTDSSEVLRLDQDISSLRDQDPHPRREDVLSVLTNEQRLKVAEFEAQLELARQAIELGLLPAPAFLRGAIFCH